MFARQLFTRFVNVGVQWNK